MTRNLVRRVAILEQQPSPAAAQQVEYDLTPWTLEQLRAAARLLAGKPNDARLTAEQVEQILDGVA